jgi:hypothetical protein
LKEFLLASSGQDGSAANDWNLRQRGRRLAASIEMSLTHVNSRRSRHGEAGAAPACTRNIPNAV